MTESTKNFYHGVTKSLIAGFGRLFSNIHIVRRKGDTVAGDPIQQIHVPIRYSARMNWYTQLLNPSRDKQTKVTLPRMCFEISGFSYDASRKKNRGDSIKCQLVNPDGTLSTQTVNPPAPWNVDITLYIITNNSEDAFQVFEQILPVFNPDVTIDIKSIFGSNISVPISLTSVSYQDDFEGDGNTPLRLVQYMLSFTCKLEYYGYISHIKQGIIDNVDFGFETGSGEIHINSKYDPNNQVIESMVWENDQGVSNTNIPLSLSPVVIVKER